MKTENVSFVTIDNKCKHETSMWSSENGVASRTCLKCGKDIEWVLGDKNE